MVRMKVSRVGSEIRILIDSGAVKTSQDGVEITLTKENAEHLLNELAKLLPYRVLKVVRDVVVEKVRPGEVVVRFNEGRATKLARVSFDVLRSHIEVLKRIGAGNAVSKREYVRLVLENMAKSANIAVANMVMSNLPFNWETFFGRRHDYYVLYYVPLLLLRKAGYVDVKQLRIKVIDVPISVKQVVEYVNEEL